MGRLNRVIEIERREVTQDPRFGDGIETWVTLAKVWAEKLEAKPSEKLSRTSARLVNTSTVQFRIWQRGDLDETMRVIDDYGVRWGIIGIIKNDRQYLTLELVREP